MLGGRAPSTLGRLLDPRAVLVAALSLGGVACAPPAALERTPVANQGPTLYSAYCLDCHGPGGLGDGPRAASFVQTPPDLSRIAQRSGGSFRADAVAARIDGRSRVDAHGPASMPVWGRKLDDRNEALPEELKLTPAQIAALVSYLETLQVP